MNPFLTTPLSLFIICYILVQAGYYTYKQITNWINRRRIIRDHGCKPARSYDDPSWFPYPFRLKLLKLAKSAAAKHTLLEVTQRKYQEHGYTHTAKVSLHPNAVESHTY